MPIPNYQALQLPLLRRLADEHTPISIRKYLDSISDEFGLTEEERSTRTPSGTENLLANRLAWARTYLGKAELVAAPKRGALIITEAGRALLATHPTEISLTMLKEYKPFLAWVQAGYTSGMEVNGSPDQVHSEAGSLTGAAENLVHTPRERIEEAKKELDRALRSDLLGRVRAMTPSEFERLIIQLLLGMGYGQGRDVLARAIGGTNDGGMDGVINQDPLGLDRVYIQAKQWKEGSGVSSPEIRNFVGALNIHRANKGVFVTASHFTPEAKRAADGSTLQVALIDGERLAELMAEHNIGVLIRDNVEIKDIDDGFFEL